MNWLNPSSIAVSALSALLAVLGAWPSWLAQAQDPGLQNAPSLTQSLKQDVEFLASEQLRGRSVTDDSINVARDYLRGRMQSIGLGLDCVGGSPYQVVEIPVGSEVRTDENNFCTVNIKGQRPVEATLNDGFGPLAIGSDRATASGHVVFAGYGITSAEHSYDDYLDVDANGAVVLILRKEPGYSDPDSPFDGVKNTRHAWFNTKVTNAIAHGAAAVLIVNDPASAREESQKVLNRIDQEQRRKAELEQTLADLPEQAVKNRASVSERIQSTGQMIEAMQSELLAAGRGVLAVGDAGTKTKQTDRIPVASIARDLADRILAAAAGDTLTKLEEEIDRTFQPASRSLDAVTADVSVDLKPAVAISDNVIGRLPGKGLLAKETIVVGAHYDHVGMGGFASLAPGTIAVHNGADDNASGTATMLACGTELKRRLEATASHRTMLFIGFTGEERGLVGSQHYVENPVLPIENTAAMINLDMVGRLRDNELTVYGTGTASGLDQLVEAANQGFEFDLFKVASGYGPSDHQSFYRAGVPVLFFFTGLHDDYHRPSDDFDKIDFGGLSRITDIVSDVACELAVRSERPEYAQTDKRVQIRRQLTAFLGVSLLDREDHVTISGVVAGGPAEQGGIKPGDRIVKLGDQIVRSAYEVIEWVRARSPGDRAKAVVTRGGKQIEFPIELSQRPN